MYVLASCACKSGIILCLSQGCCYGDGACVGQTGRGEQLSSTTLLMVLSDTDEALLNGVPVIKKVN